MTEDEARRIAAVWLLTRPRGNDFHITSIRLYDDVAIAFYNTKDGTLVAGNAPLLIDAKTKALHVTGTAGPIDRYLRNFRITGNPHTEPVEAVKITAWQVGAKTVSGITLIKETTDLGLVGAKNIIDAVLAGKSSTLFPKAGVQADDVCAELNRLGFVAEKLLCAPSKMT